MSNAQKAGRSQANGPWDSALAQLQAWDLAWADACAKMSTNPWTTGTLSRKLIELIGVALNAACSNLNPDGTRRHIRAALDAGASRDEILTVLKMASLLSIHSCSLGAPILLEEAVGSARNSMSCTPCFSSSNIAMPRMMSARP